MLKNIKNNQKKKKEIKKRKDRNKVYQDIEMYNGKEWEDNENNTNII